MILALILLKTYASSLNFEWKLSSFVHKISLNLFDFCF